jgi:hypothetical protein
MAQAVETLPSKHEAPVQPKKNKTEQKRTEYSLVHLLVRIFYFGFPQFLLVSVICLNS